MNNKFFDESNNYVYEQNRADKEVYYSETQSILYYNNKFTFC